MDNQNRGNPGDTDKTGEIISWVIIFILLFAFWPLGLILLFRKLRGYSKPGQQTRKTPTATVYAPRQTTQSTAAYAPTQTVQNTAVYAPPQAAQNTSAYAQSQTAQSSSPYAPPPYAVSTKKKNKGKNRHPLEKKTGRFIAFVLLLMSIVMIITGVVGYSTAISQIFGPDIIDWYNIGMSTFFMGGGVVTFLSRNIVAHRYSRYKNYYAFIDGRGIVQMSDLAQVAGVPVKTVKSDLQAMINNGYLDRGAYIDNELECLVLSAEDARKLRMEIKGAEDDLLQQVDEMQQNQYVAILAELREVNSFIADEAIKEKVAHLEDLTAKIFRIVEETPDKESQIRRFMSYYLPTTLKLVRSYATLEKQGIKGENIISAKQSIGNILDTLSTGFEQQLDKLFTSDVIDIAADINVLENLMQQDGLTGDKPEFQVLEI